MFVTKGWLLHCFQRISCTCTFPIWNQSVVQSTVLTVASWPTYKFLRRQVRWSGIPISWRIFHSLLWSTSQGFCVVNEAEVEVFSGILLLFLWSNRCWQFDLWFHYLFWIQLVYLEFSVQILLKPSLKDLEHNLTSTWNKQNYTGVWTFFGIALLCYCNENWPFPVLWPLLSFPNLLTYWVQHFHSIIFQDLK